MPGVNQVEKGRRNEEYDNGIMLLELFSILQVLLVL